MRVEWHPEKVTEEIERLAMDQLEEVGESIAEKARILVPVGVDRPQYKNGKEWTARKAGALRDSIRVTRLKGDPKQNIRVYAGSENVYYARWVEYGSVHNDTPRKPFLRPALRSANSALKRISGK